MAIPAQKNYEEYLPNQASLGLIAYMTKSVTVAGKTSSRRYYDNEEFKIYYVDYSGVETRVVDPTSEYAEGTFTTGDEVKIEAIGLKYKYAGIEDLVVVAENLDEKHPLAKDDFDILTNSSFWVCIGVIDELKPFDGSSSSSLHSASHNILVKRRIGGGNPQNDGCSINVFFSGAGCDLEMNEHYYDFDEEKWIFYLSHSSSHVFADRISILDKDYTSQLAIDFIHRVGVFIRPPYIRFIGDDGSIFEPIGNVSVSAVCYTTWFSLGAQLTNHTSNRVSEYKTVISDGVEKQIVSKSYDVFSGDIVVNKADLKKVEYLLMKATQGDYIFHIGAGELHDNRVYLGKLKYTSPIKDEDKYTISISGQSLSYDVQNPLISEDSTSGYPV